MQQVERKVVSLSLSLSLSRKGIEKGVGTIPAGGLAGEGCRRNGINYFVPSNGRERESDDAREKRRGGDTAGSASSKFNWP